MLYAIKGNKEVVIDEKEKQLYLNTGYDIYNEELELVQASTTKVITYTDYQAVVDELKAVKEELAKYKKSKKTNDVTQESDK